MTNLFAILPREILVQCVADELDMLALCLTDKSLNSLSFRMTKSGCASLDLAGRQSQLDWANELLIIQHVNGEPVPMRPFQIYIPTTNNIEYPRTILNMIYLFSAGGSKCEWSTPNQYIIGTESKCRAIVDASLRNDHRALSMYLKTPHLAENSWQLMRAITAHGTLASQIYIVAGHMYGHMSCGYTHTHEIKCLRNNHYREHQMEISARENNNYDWFEEYCSNKKASHSERFMWLARALHSGDITQVKNIFIHCPGNMFHNAADIARFRRSYSTITEEQCEFIANYFGISEPLRSDESDDDGWLTQSD